MYRIFAIEEPLDPNDVEVLCMDGDHYYFSRHSRDIKYDECLYSTIAEVLDAATLIVDHLPIYDAGIQCKGVNGKWYLYNNTDNRADIEELAKI